jgi:hypothetical protein
MPFLSSIRLRVLLSDAVFDGAEVWRTTACADEASTCAAFVKRHKGIIPIPTGGSTKGTTLAHGDWGLRIKGQGVRLAVKQLTTAEEVIKRKIKPIKGAKVYLRVFPHIPVCIKVCCVFNTDFTGLVDIT